MASCTDFGPTCFGFVGGTGGGATSQACFDDMAAQCGSGFWCTANGYVFCGCLYSGCTVYSPSYPNYTGSYQTCRKISSSSSSSSSSTSVSSSSSSSSTSVSSSSSTSISSSSSTSISSSSSTRPSTCAEVSCYGHQIGPKTVGGFGNYEPQCLVAVAIERGACAGDCSLYWSEVECEFLVVTPCHPDIDGWWSAVTLCCCKEL